ncbi:MAG: phosphoribosylanthranilate isomerase [Gemmataceae bacterium]|nr:phosphoribosylanthranilate isomerase [Gemmataceae bacterium]MDW8242943.1 phosphoribosylanthranilate isomerase [Thermogemmata sp.]
MGSTIRIKICGVTDPEEARAIAELGADAIGLNFYAASPRYVPFAQAAALLRVLPPFVAPVGVFVGVPMRQVCAIAYQLGLRAVQTYHDPPLREDAFPFAHIPAFRIREAADITALESYLAAAQQNSRLPAAVLLDAFVPGQWGGTGQAAPWELLENLQLSVPWILAGGLTPDNVGEAIRRLRPWGVDVASGVEWQPGRKDLDKVRRFIDAARSAAT